jgi:hypothetical protein
MRWARHVAHMIGIKNAHRISVGKPEGQRPLGRPRRRWGIILECISGKWVVKMWTCCIWLRIGISAGLL